MSVRRPARPARSSASSGSWASAPLARERLAAEERRRAQVPRSHEDDPDQERRHADDEHAADAEQRRQPGDDAQHDEHARDGDADGQRRDDRRARARVDPILGRDTAADVEARIVEYVAAATGLTADELRAAGCAAPA
jgi:hypothetical protein